MARPRRSKRKIQRKQFYLRVVGVLALVSITISIGCVAVLERKRNLSSVVEKSATRVAFGSCTSFDYEPQPVWVHGVIPSKPDAWIWLGDMAYMDKPRVNCDAMPWHQQCNCTSDWLRQAGYSCMAGNSDFASSRIEVQLSNPDYAQFLAFMCPGHRAKGLHPPTGTDPSVCSRPIFGTYNDHDYGWEHGNKRLPDKDNLKQVFLSAVGEPHNSLRRSLGRGIEWKYTLNEGDLDREIEVYLLDERYYRDTLPCHMRRPFCEKVALPDAQHPKHAWCLDFLHGGESGTGTCCAKDDQIFYGWCLQIANKENPLWADACDPNSPGFGKVSLSFDNSGNLQQNDFGESSFCEVLGIDQRLWLEDVLLKSKAPLKLVVSSSALLGNPAKKTCEDLGLQTDEVACPCSGDDWECYKPAQLDFLQLLSHSDGCVIVLTGDYQYSDIRVLRPDQQVHMKNYGDIHFTYPLFQVMSSGLTTSTGLNFSCDVLRRDPLGLRDHDECNFVRGPSFGVVEVQWENEPLVRLQIRDGMTGSIKLESNLSLRSCQQKRTFS